MVDRLAGTRLRRDAAIRRGEKAVHAAALTALHELGRVALAALQSAGMDPAVLDSRNPVWQALVTDTIEPAVQTVFTTAFATEAREVLTAAAEPVPDGPARRAMNRLATVHLLSTHNRMVGIADTVFELIRAALAEGQQIGEGIPQLAARVQALLSDRERWSKRATVIARTEAIAANNSGHDSAASYNASRLGFTDAQVVRQWLATSDARTRPAHADADGTQVMGISTPFSVGGALLRFPGDPDGPAELTIQCRCTTLYFYPGDPGYPATLTASAADDPGGTLVPTTEETTMAEDDSTPTSVVVVALPAADDPVQGIGGEQKHATLLFFGDIAGTDDDPNPGLTDEFRALLSQVIASVAESTGPFTEQVNAVESLGDDGARVWMLAGDALPGVRDGLLDTDAEVIGVLEAVEQYPSYTPHVTIGYPATDPEDVPEGDRALLDPDTEVAAADVATITFDRLALWWAGEQTEWALAAATPEEEAPADEPTTEATAGLRTFQAVRDKALAALDAAMTEAFADAEVAPEAAPAPEGTPEVAQDIPTDGEPLYGILWPENVMSGDGRQIDAGATVWRDLPLPLMSQEATMPGHDGAVRVARIDNIWRDSDRYSVPVIRYDGVWDTSEAAVETNRQVEAKMLRGLSVDGDDVTVELRDSNGQTLDPMVDEFPDDGVVIEVATAARVAGATACSIPAFQQAYVANGVYDPAAKEPGWNDDGTPIASGQVPDAPAVDVEDPEAETPAVAASAAPAWSLVASALSPVVEARYFANPGLTEPTNLTVDDDGHVYGHLATWGVCHIGIEGICQEAPDSASNYAFFAKGVVHTDDGNRVKVGPLTMGTGHANMRMGMRAAVEHYDNTGTVVADVAMGQDGLGIWFSGRVRPGTTPEQVYAMRAAGAVSGDWREPIRNSGDLDLVAALVVNVPGFPIAAPAVAASGGLVTALVASGVVRPANDAVGSVSVAVSADPASVAQFGDAVITYIDRKNRATAAAARIETMAAATRLRRSTAATTRLAAQQAHLRATRVAAAAARLERA